MIDLKVERGIYGVTLRLCLGARLCVYLCSLRATLSFYCTSTQQRDGGNIDGRVGGTASWNAYLCRPL